MLKVNLLGVYKTDLIQPKYHAPVERSALPLPGQTNFPNPPPLKLNNQYPITNIQYRIKFTAPSGSRAIKKPPEHPGGLNCEMMGD